MDRDGLYPIYTRHLEMGPGSVKERRSRPCVKGGGVPTAD